MEPDRQYTFKEIERFAKNCAALILQRTSATRQPVPVFLPKSARAIIAYLGILCSGNCYANLDASVVITSTPHVAALRVLDIPEHQLLLVEQAMTYLTVYFERKSAAAVR